MKQQQARVEPRVIHAYQSNHSADTRAYLEELQTKIDEDILRRRVKQKGYLRQQNFEELEVFGKSK